MFFSELEKIISGKKFIRNDLEISRFSADTRTLGGSPGEVFVALKGKRDGHQFIQEAIEKGVQNFIIGKRAHAENANFIEVADPLIAFQQIAEHHRTQFSIPIIGITGSNGKTTTKELIHAVLKTQFNAQATVGNFNNHIGTIANNTIRAVN